MSKPITNTLHELVWLIDKYADNYLQKYHMLTFKKFHVLTLVQVCQPAKQAQLARVLHYSPAAVSRSIKLLESEGLVSVSSDESNDLYRIISLTPKGRRVVESAGTELERIFVSMMNEANVDTLKVQSDLSRTIDIVIREQKDLEK